MRAAGLAFWGFLERVPPQNAALGPHGAGGDPSSVRDEGHGREDPINDSVSLTIGQEAEAANAPLSAPQTQR